LEVIYGLLPGMLLLGIIGVGLFFWAVRNGQYDDMDGAANRVLMDDDLEERNNATGIESNSGQNDVEKNK